MRRDGQVDFLTAAGEMVASISVEIARDRNSRVRGLRYQKFLPPSWGMLFVYDQERQVSFSMRETAIPLDLIFVDRYGKVVRIVEKVQPYSRPAYSSLFAVLYVVEVNAGFCQTHGVLVGGKILMR